MTELTPFRLHWNEVPDPPKSKAWACHLRWCIAVMDDDDDDMGFVASLLAHTCKSGGLTHKQARYAQRILDRIAAHHSGGYLDCQQSETRPAEPEGNVVSLRPVEGF